MNAREIPSETPNSVERFSNRVENYVRYRPDYPREIVSFLASAIGLTRSDLIADIGSGTGISSKLFLENGNLVFGIEPNAAMRNAAENFLRDFPNFISIDGTAESTNLQEHSVDVVIAAQAFHWFDLEKTPKELRRILKPNGNLVLIWNERRLDSTDFLRKYEELICRFANDYEIVRHDRTDIQSLEAMFKKKLLQKTFENYQLLDFQGLKGRMLSASYMPDENSPRFDEMISDLEVLFAKHQENGRIRILYDTNVFYAEP